MPDQITREELLDKLALWRWGGDAHRYIHGDNVDKPSERAVVELQDVANLIDQYTTERERLAVREATAKDAKRLYELNNIIKQYGIVNYVKSYKEAQGRGWTDIRLPVPVNRILCDYTPITTLTNTN